MSTFENRVLLADSVTEGAAHLAAFLLSDHYEHGGVLEFNVAEPMSGSTNFLGTVRRLLPSEVVLSLSGCDTNAEAVKQSRRFLGKIMLGIGTIGNDTLDINTQGVGSFMANLEPQDIIYFNPPYRREDDRVRRLFQEMPPESMFVPIGEDPTYYYSQVLPLLNGKIKENGYALIRTPREPYWRNRIYSLTSETFGSDHTIHTIVTHGGKQLDGPRIGRLLAVEHADSLRMRYTAVEQQYRRSAKCHTIYTREIRDDENSTQAVAAYKA